MNMSIDEINEYIMNEFSELSGVSADEIGEESELYSDLSIDDEGLETAFSSIYDLVPALDGFGASTEAHNCVTVGDIFDAVSDLVIS